MGESVTEKTPWIYESPDGGKTVTRRKMGQDISERELVKDLSQLNLFENE